MGGVLLFYIGTAGRAERKDSAISHFPFSILETVKKLPTSRLGAFVNLKRVYRALLIVARLEQVILDALASSLNLSLLRYLSYAYTPPSLVTCGHGLRQNLHVDQGGNGLLLSVLDCSLQLVKSLNGVGLAAPQVGIRKRLVVIDCGDDPIVLINPVVLETSGSQTGLEGCLSVPGKTGEVTRPNYAKVKALNENMEEIIVEGEELLARCLLHEIDHLDGIMYVDKVEGELLSTDDIEEE